MKGVSIADIKDPRQYKFSKIDFRKQRTIRGEMRLGKIPVELNEVILFKTYSNCFAISPVELVWKTKGISVVYELKDLSKVHLAGNEKAIPPKTGDTAGDGGLGSRRDK
ncbi:MAG: hypothetical protein K8R46_00590 [Pirellulales bacterium]|nr:hypothetical protein [Pirellulales bacterium]